MRLLVPRLIDDLAEDAVADLVRSEARAPAGDRPWVVVNMVATADGAVAVDGRSGPLGGPADKVVFHALRAAADVVLVGAATVRAERYGPARPRPDGSPGPAIAVVTRSGDLDPAARVFSAGRALVVTCEACPADRRAALAAAAEVVMAGGAEVELGVALDALAARGARVVLAEGGPTLNGQLVAGGFVDEWCVTVSPLLAAGDGMRAAIGPLADPPVGLSLVRVLADDSGMLLLRYLRR